MECFFREPDAFVGFEVAALFGERGEPKFFLLFQMPGEQLFLCFEKFVRKQRKFLQLVFVDMGFDVSVLGSQQSSLNGIDNSPKTFVYILTKIIL